ncbi:MAG: helix-turn-helix domain-containing protein [Halobacteriales archaeon]|nr:helix-turn-helix domain-containing protein [Halobacteriales archaeon]
MSELTDVPRTRIYDSVSVLESEGLVEVQHSNPKKFRAVSLGEATETLRSRYDEQIEKVEDALEGLEKVNLERATAQEVWSLTGSRLIEKRTNELIKTAESEVVLVIGHESILTKELLNSLNRVGEDVDILVGTLNDEARERINEEVPRVRTFDSGLEWLEAKAKDDYNATIGRILLIDRYTLLLSSLEPDSMEEYAVFGEGFGNGLLVIARKIIAQGLEDELD